MSLNNLRLEKTMKIIRTAVFVSLLSIEAFKLLYLGLE